MEFVNFDPLLELRVNNVVAVIVQKQAFRIRASGNIVQIFGGALPLYKWNFGEPFRSETVVDQGAKNWNACFVANSRVDENMVKRVAAKLEEREEAGARELADSVGNQRAFQVERNGCDSCHLGKSASDDRQRKFFTTPP